MDRFVPLSATTSTLGAHLAPDEEILTLQENVGLYHGSAKSQRQADGTLYLSSHRIIYVDHLSPLHHSCALNLALVRQTEHYTGFLKSSPKITLRLEPPPAHVLAAQKQQQSRLPKPSPLSPSSAAATTAASTTPKYWTCPVCSCPNEDTPKCALCGIPYERSNRDRPSRSLPASKPVEPTASPSLAPTVATDSSFPESDPAIEHVKLSFRKGGDKAFYELLKTTLRQKAWLVSHVPPGARPGSSIQPGLSASPALPPSGSSTLSPSANDLFGPSSPARSTRGTPLTGSSSPYTRPSSSSGTPSVPSFATTVDIDGRRVPMSILSQSNYGAATPSSFASSAYPDPSSRPSAVGIEAILRTTSLSHSQNSTDMLSALGDLEALQKRAKSMVEMAEKLNAQLTRLEAASASPQQANSSGTNSVDSDSATLIRSSLVMLGLPSPAVTPDMVAERSLYELELARELASLLLSHVDDEDESSIESYHSKTRRSKMALMGQGRVLGKGKERSMEEIQELDRSEEELRLLSKSNAAALVELVEMRIAQARKRRLAASNAQQEDGFVTYEDDVEELERVLAESAAGSDGDDVGAAGTGLGRRSGARTRARGLLGLDEVWCVWNRARGVALVPPSDLRACAVHLPRLTEPPLRLRVFPASPSTQASKASKRTGGKTGLCILHTPRYSQSAFEARVLVRLRFTARAARTAAAASQSTTISNTIYGPGLSAFELASRERAPVVLIEQMLSGLEGQLDDLTTNSSTGGSKSRPGEYEMDASIVRDNGKRSGQNTTGIGGGGSNTRWYENEFGKSWESVLAYRAGAVRAA